MTSEPRNMETYNVPKKKIKIKEKVTKDHEILRHQCQAGHIALHECISIEKYVLLCDSLFYFSLSTVPSVAASILGTITASPTTGQQSK